MVGSTIASWRGDLHPRQDAVTLDYTAIGEPQTGATSPRARRTSAWSSTRSTRRRQAGRRRLRAGLGDRLVVAFQMTTTRTAAGHRSEAQCPTGRQAGHRSYRSGGNQAVITNPVNIFRDPELQRSTPA